MSFPRFKTTANSEAPPLTPAELMHARHRRLELCKPLAHVRDIPGRFPYAVNEFFRRYGFDRTMAQLKITQPELTEKEAGDFIEYVTRSKRFRITDVFRPTEANIQ